MSRLKWNKIILAAKIILDTVEDTNLAQRYTAF